MTENKRWEHEQRKQKDGTGKKGTGEGSGAKEGAVDETASDPADRGMRSDCGSDPLCPEKWKQHAGSGSAGNSQCTRKRISFRQGGGFQGDGI
jgi:hypothetical protein